jgi:hypothetical protein
MKDVYKTKSLRCQNGELTGHPEESHAPPTPALCQPLNPCVEICHLHSPAVLTDLVQMAVLIWHLHDLVLYTSCVSE